MSGARAVEEDRPGGDTSDTGIEARARTMGWKPKEEYRGPAEAWRDAEEFVRRGEEELPVLRERSRATERRLQAVQSQLSESTAVITDLTERVRNSDERAYKRARADLLKERAAAVETGDTTKFNQVEAELVDLDTTKPKPLAERRAVAQPPEGSTDVHPDALAWANENPWYHSDAQMRNAALSLHTQLLQAEPDLSVKENLARVTASVSAMFPGRVGNSGGLPPRRPRPPAEQDDEEPDDNPRRREPAAVGSGQERRPRDRNARSFDAMPKDSKDAYTRYAKQLEGKGKPLTKEEWAADYWSQFQEA